jgi:hypothetical protein
MPLKTAEAEAAAAALDLLLNSGDDLSRPRSLRFAPDNKEGYS